MGQNEVWMDSGFCRNDGTGHWSDGPGSHLLRVVFLILTLCLTAAFPAKKEVPRGPVVLDEKDYNGSRYQLLYFKKTRRSDAGVYLVKDSARYKGSETAEALTRCWDHQLFSYRGDADKGLIDTENGVLYLHYKTGEKIFPVPFFSSIFSILYSYEEIDSLSHGGHTYHCRLSSFKNPLGDIFFIHVYKDELPGEPSLDQIFGKAFFHQYIDLGWTRDGQSSLKSPRNIEKVKFRLIKNPMAKGKMLKTTLYYDDALEEYFGIGLP